jgi:hypothetical protein
VRPRVGPAFLKRRLQSVGWSPDFFISFSFFWPNSRQPAKAAAAGASGLYCLSLFLERVRRTSAHFSQSSMRAKTLRYLNCWPSESSPYMSNARRICTEKPASSQIGDQMSMEKSEYLGLEVGAANRMIGDLLLYAVCGDPAYHCML